MSSFLKILRRGQLSLELMVIVGILVLMLSFFSMFSFGRYQDFVSDRQTIEAKAIVREAASELNTAIVVGDGYSRVFQLPGALSDGEDYVVRTIPAEQSVEIAWRLRSFAAPLLSSDVEEKTLSKGNNTVTNQGGQIRIA